MHPQFLEILCCPITGEPLELMTEKATSSGSVFSGVLVSSSGRRYPIVRGIPRFVESDAYASSFSYEWHLWPRLQFESENVGKPMEGHTTRMWEEITGADDQLVCGKTTAEFGCGPGRFLDVVRRKGGRAVGLDISQAVEEARKNFENDPDVLIVQADALRPPFRKGVFDGCYSIGVFHHSPDPEEGVISMAATVRGGGWTAVCVYPKGEFYDYPSVARFRKLNKTIHRRLGYLPALIYSFAAVYCLAPILGAFHHLPALRPAAAGIEKNWLVILRLPDKKWAVLDTFDAITPTNATTHSGAEVAGWMDSADLQEVHQTSFCETSWSGKKIGRDK